MIPSKTHIPDLPETENKIIDPFSPSSASDQSGSIKNILFEIKKQQQQQQQVPNHLKQDLIKTKKKK